MQNVVPVRLQLTPAQVQYLKKQATGARYTSMSEVARDAVNAHMISDARRKVAARRKP